MKVAVDTCIGNRAMSLLTYAGHEVVAFAEHGEPDRAWFTRALAAGADVVIAADNDLAILCYDHNLKFFRAEQGMRDTVVVQRFLARLLKYGKNWD